MTSDAVKFFQAFIAQMAEVGGLNLPRSIASKLGYNLGEMYRKKGKEEVIVALKSMFQGMGGTITDVVMDEDGSGFTIMVDYANEFCPIGGNNKQKRFRLFTEAVCKPYAKGFIAAFSPGSKVELVVHQCLLKEGDTSCCIHAGTKL